MSYRNASVVFVAVAAFLGLTQETAGQDSFEYRFAFGTVCS